MSVNPLVNAMLSLGASPDVVGLHGAEDSDDSGTQIVDCMGDCMTHCVDTCTSGCTDSCVGNCGNDCGGSSSSSWKDIRSIGPVTKSTTAYKSGYRDLKTKDY